MAKDRRDSVATSSNEKFLISPVTPAETVVGQESHAPSEKGLKDATVDAKPSVVAPEVPPVSFFTLFQFATWFEIAMNLFGLVCAAAAGAAQPLMSLIFGRLTVSFVNFGIYSAAVQGPNPTPSDYQNFEDARAAFKSAAALDAAYLVAIGAGMFLATWVYMLTWVHTGEVNAKRIRERYLQSVLRQDIAFFDTLGAGEVATRIQTDTHLIQQGISEKVPLSVSFAAAFVTGFALAFARSWRLALALSSILPCMIITGGLMAMVITKQTQASLKAIADAGSLAEEVISTIRTAQAFGTQITLSNLYNSIVQRSYIADSKTAFINGFGMSTFFFVIYSAYSLAFSFGTTLILRNEANAGTVVNVFIAILIGSFSLVMLAPEMQAITNARGAAAKIFDTIARVPPIDSASPEGLRPAHVEGKIVLKDVNFDYPSRPDVRVLKGIDLTFPAGHTAALVGASGSGKSTVIQLIERFYDPISGTVELDGVPLPQLNVKWLRSQIGLVSQEPTLFATSIKGNVAHGLIGSRFEHVSEEEKTKLVLDACIMANADSFIEKLPDGYETMVGERGFLLSGGQKQRIAIARAIVSDPRILLLDEATSALDTQSEGIVQNALDKASRGRTTITIAHRLSTIRDADCIYVMGDGMILEQGTHNELLSSDGAYSRLVNAQKLRERVAGKDDDETAPPTPDVVDEKMTRPGEMTQAELEQAKRDEFPLGRTTTGSNRSIASELLEKRRQADVEAGKIGRNGEKEYSMTYLFRRMGKISASDWKKYALGSCFASLTGTVYPVFGIVYGVAIQTFQVQDRHQLRKESDRNALYFFIIAIVTTIAIGLQMFLFAAGAASLTNKLRKLSFKAILRQDIGWFDEDKHSTGALTSNLSDAPQKISGLAGVTLGAIVQSIATLVSGTIIGLIYGWKLALVGVACMPFLVSAGFIRLRVVVLKDQVNKKAHEESAQMACEAAAAIRTVASLTREDECVRDYSESLLGPLHKSNRTAVWSNLLFSFSQSAAFFAISLVFYYGSRLVANLEYNTKNFFICLMSVTFGAIQAGNVFSFVPDMSSAKGAATDIINMIDSVPEIDAESTEGKHVAKATGRIQFIDVHFRYPTRPGTRVLRSLNITVEPGTYVALVGASGCGKSTTIQLIERFYDPLAGTILLDGENIADINIQDYRRQIALVSQEPTLYAGTVKFNVLLGATKPHEEVTQDEIENACREANILEFILSLPNGFETEVGGKGSQLSGGQKQRIAIARALLRNPKVLLLDEATSALDSQSEKVVQAALDNAAKNRTTIAIAHRLSTIQNADRIYVIKDGRVGEAGTHDELLKLRGQYYELVQLQALSKH